MLRMFAMAAQLGVLAASQPGACIDTPGWANRCVATSHGACSSSQFPFGNQSGYWNGDGPDAGWTCKMYNRTWCKGGKLVQRSAGGAKYNFPQKNCCACGRGRAPVPTPPPPPPSQPQKWLCGGACSDGMVLDRANARLWGYAHPMSVVMIVLAGQPPGEGMWSAKAEPVTGDDPGFWLAQLGPQTAGCGNNLTIESSGGKTASLTDVCFGDVLLCSGQSNMEYPLSSIVNGSAVLAEADTLGANVRVMRVDHLSTMTAQRTLTWGKSWDGTGDRCTDRCGGPWQRMASSGLGPAFSAVCYLTGRDVYLGLGGAVPIGLVEAAWGGTRIEAWTTQAGLAQCPGVGTAKCGPCCLTTSHVLKRDASKWCTETEPASKPACGRMNSSNSGNLCSADFNGMLAPILPMRFKAMLWYQGESNTDSFQGTDAGAVNYACRMRAAVQDWRSALDAPDLPFFNVELAACDNYPDKASNHFIWAAIRQASRSFLSLSGTTGFITTIDVGIKGHAVHSNVKQPDGRRMARQLLSKVYGQSGVIADGPTLAARPVLSASGLTMAFRGAEGLHADAVANADIGCAESPFELGAADGSWTRANFSIQGASITLALPAAPSASAALATTYTEVRYCWEGFPQCAVYSGVGNYSSDRALPAAPFRVAVGAACAATQSRCLLGKVAIGADPDTAQCCQNGNETCVPYGGCQTVVPK